MTFKDFNALLLRLFFGYLFTSSGLCKLTNGQFGQLIGPPLLIEQLTPHGLRTFAFFIAISQVMSGALVLSQRYSILGLIMLVPMNLGILMVTISQNWQGTPYVDAVFTFLNILALLYEWNTLKFLLIPEVKTISLPTKTHSFFPSLWLPLVIMCIFLLCCITSRYAVVLTSILATLGYVLAYVNVFRSQVFPKLFQGVLGMSLLAILAFTWVGLTHKTLPFNPMFIVGTAVFGTILMYITTLGWELFRKKQ